MDTNKPQQIQSLYHFGNFRLDASERQLWCKNQPITLTNKQFELLYYFVENPGRVAKKGELLDAVWSDSFVAESTLARNVSWLRKKFREFLEEEDEQIIETVPKIGYRFVADVTQSAKNGNMLIIEEQTTHLIQGEETITIDDSDSDTFKYAGTDNKQSKFSNSNPAFDRLTPITQRRQFSVITYLTAALALMLVMSFCFVIYQNYLKTDELKFIKVSNIQIFTGLAGYENSPAFSPDGKLLAYSWNGGEGENTDIYVKIVGAGNPLRLTDTKANEQYPAFSPDGKYIAFIRGKYGEPGDVIIVPAIGGTERKVARLFSGNYSISYSPDGEHIAVVDTEDSRPTGQFAIYLINIKSGKKKRLTAPGKFDGESTPRFSPDGKSVAFIRSTVHLAYPGAGKHDLFVAQVGEEKEPLQLTFDGVIIHSLAWSGDGKYIYFVPYRTPSQTFVKRIPAEGGKQENISISGNEITNIAVSPSGGKLVFAENPLFFSIWEITPDGQPAKRLIKSTTNEGYPNFSPDGSQITFQSDRTKSLQIWTADANGGNLRQITDTSYQSINPRFSPDGSQIVFNQKKGEDFANYIIPAEGGRPRRISPKGFREDQPVWNPDGKFIYFISNRTGQPNVWKTRSDGKGEAVQITRGGAKFATPSPDGKTVYFVRELTLKEMWQVPAEGGAEIKVPEFTNSGFLGSWVMKKNGIYFIAGNSEQGFQLKFYDFTDKKIKSAPGDYKFPTNLQNTYFFTTDGKVLLTTVLEKSSRLMIADLQ